MGASSRTKAERRRQRRERVVVKDRVGPTAETLAKLLPDPLVVMHREGLIDDAARDGALEIRKVYMAVAGHLLTKARGEGGRAVMSAEVAWVHANRYLPWAQGYGGGILGPLIGMIVDGEPPDWMFRDTETGKIVPGPVTEACARALKAYARVRIAKPIPRNLDRAA